MLVTSLRFRAGRLAACPVFLILSFGSFAAADDWSHIRGPDYSAHSAEDLVLDWDGEVPPLVWSVHIGQGFSSSTIVGNRLYTQSQKPAGQFVVCIDLRTGRELWRTRYGWSWQPDGQWSGPFATPTLVSGELFFAGCYGEVGCMDADSGSIKWQVNPVTDFKGKGVGFGYAASPAVEDGRVYVPIGGKNASVMALDAGTGEIVWKTGSDRASYSPCLPVLVGGRKQIVTFMQNSLVAHDARTGKELWRDEWEAGYDEHAAWPVYREPYLFCASPFREGARVYRLSWDDRGARAERVWGSDVISNDVTSSLQVDGFLYGFDVRDAQADDYGDTSGTLKCIELATGHVQWESADSGHVSILAVGAHLLMLNEGGTIIVADLSPDRYTERRRFQVSKEKLCWTPPVFAQGCLVVKTGERLSCYYLGPEEGMPDLGASAGRVLEEEPAWYRTVYGSSFYAPEWSDIWSWYWIGLLVAVGFPLLVVRVMSRFFRWSWIGVGVAMCVGVVGALILTELLSVRFERLIFLWPAGLYIVAQLVLGVCAVGATRSEWGWDWGCRGGLLFLAGACLAYYQLCLHTGIAMGGGFLTGLVALAPIGVWLGRRYQRLGLERGTLMLLILGYTLFFGCGAAFTVWKTA